MSRIQKFDEFINESVGTLAFFTVVGGAFALPFIMSGLQNLKNFTFDKKQESLFRKMNRILTPLKDDEELNEIFNKLYSLFHSAAENDFPGENETEFKLYKSLETKMLNKLKDLLPKEEYEEFNDYFRLFLDYLKKEDYKKIINQIKKETKNNNLTGDKKIADSIISDIKNNREHFGKFISNCKKNWTRGDMDDKEERDLHVKCLKEYEDEIKSFFPQYKKLLNDRNKIYPRNILQKTFIDDKNRVGKFWDMMSYVVDGTLGLS